MDNERKKNRLIRFLGRLGRRVKFLQKPLTVLVILGVSIHHLLKKFFFDVNYHTARMRVLTGSLCFALLFTLFVIPAIADEGDFDLTDVVTEEIQLPTEEPAPAPEPDLTEEVPADQPVQNGGEIIPAPTDIPAAPENTDIIPEQNVPVDGAGDGYTPQDPVAPNTWTTDDGIYYDNTLLNNDGTVLQPGDQVTGTDGETYEVDDEGNLIDGDGNVVDTMTRSLRQGPAVRGLQALETPEPTTPLVEPSWTDDTGSDVTSNTDEVSYGEDITLAAHVKSHYSPGDALGNGCTYKSSEFRFIWSVKFESNEARNFWNTYSAGYQTFTANMENFYSIDSGSGRRFYGAGSSPYVFSCLVKEYITYTYDDQTGTHEAVWANESLPDQKDKNIAVKKKVFDHSDFTLDSALDVDGQPAVDISTNSGNVFDKPTLKNSDAYPELKGKYPFKYRFVNRSGGATVDGENTGESARTNTYLFVQEGDYDLYVTFEKASDKFEIKNESFKVVKMQCSKDVITPADLTYELESGTVSTAVPVNVDGKYWVGGLKINVKSGYLIGTDLDGYKKYTNPFVAGEGGPASDANYPAACPVKLHFSTINYVKTESEVDASYDGNSFVYIDKTGPEIVDGSLAFTSNNVIPVTDETGTKYYIKEDGTGKVGIEVNFRDVQGDKSGGSASGSEVKTVQYRMKQEGGTFGEWSDMSVQGGKYVADDIDISNIEEKKGGVIEVRAIDNVGNSSESNSANEGKCTISFFMKDTQAPKFKVEMDEGEEGLPEAAREAEAEVSTIYISEGRKVTFIVSDDASGVTKGRIICPGGSAEDDSSGGVNVVKVLYDSNIVSTTQPEKTVTIEASDKAGNKSYVKVKFIRSSDTVYEADTSLIPIPDAYYGYTDVGCGGDALEILVSMFKTPLQQDESISIKGGIKITPADEDAGAAPIFEIPEGEIYKETGTFKIRPISGLPVKKHPTDADKGSPYKAVLEINYTLYKTVSGVKSIVDRHVVSRPVQFTVNPVQLSMNYKGSDEYYHTREYERDAVKKEWFDNNIEITGFVPGEDVSVLGDDRPEIKHEAVATNDDIKLSSNMGILTDDGYIIDNGSLTFSFGDENLVAAESLNNYNYYYKKNDSFSGTVTCIRREIKEGYTIKSDSDYNKEDGEKGSSGRVGGNTEWYVEDMILESVKDKYLLYDATDPKTDASGNIDYSDINGKDGYKVAQDTKDENLESEQMFKAHTDKFYDPGDMSTVVKYYYVLNKETREISSQMIERIRIDTTNPGWDGKTLGGNTRARKPNIPDGATGEVDNDTNHPYFYIEKNLWKEFLNTVTGKMFFNDIMDVKVRCNYDKQSGPNKTYIAIIPKEYDTEQALSEDASVEWDTFSGDASISKEKQKSGYIYIKITNSAGLNCYIRSEPFIVFDTEGPEVYSDYDGEEKVQGTSHAVKDGEEFIADEVTFKVEDAQSLYCASGSAVIPAIRVYKGTEISKETNVIADKDITIYNEGVKSEEFTLPASDDWYTIVAKDNSGLITTRYFKVSKPVYGLAIDTLEFNTEVYGTPLGQSLEMKWKKTGNATPTITDLKIEPEGDFTYKPGNARNEFVISPSNKLDAGLHVGKITATYNDGKKATGECRLTVKKKLLVASFGGGTIYKGQKITQKNGVVSGFIEGSKTIDVTGFVGDETEATAADYVSPTITIPEYPSETMIVTPKGGSAKNYIFENSSNVGGVITVLTDKAAKNTHYTVEGTLSSTGWYISNIKIKPKTGYQLTKDAAGSGATNEINIYDDTNAGEEKFYIKDSATTGEKAGEVYEQSVFSYKKDVVNPQITGVADGMTYQENKKTVTVKDDYLYRVAVNGVRQAVTKNKSEFDVVATETQGTFFITAEDYAGHITTATISLLQPDGSAPEGSEATTSSLHPEDDVIQDDTEDGTDTDLGTLTRKVQLVDGAPSTTFTSTISELKTGVLDASERAVMREGSDANVKLRVQNIDGSVSQADKELVIAALGDYTVAQYLDITLWKTVGNGEEKQVRSTNNPISVTISIPNSFRSPKSGKVRQFAIVRVHNGSSTVLQDKDSSANTITISTSKFSVYALAYRDADKGSTNSGSGNTAGSGRGNSGGGSSSGGGNSSGGGSSSGGSTGGTGGGGYSGGSSGGSSGGGSAETGGVAAPAPRTGDSSPIVPVAIGFGVAFVGLIAFIIIRRRMNYEWVYLGDDGKYYDKDGNLYEDED